MIGRLLLWIVLMGFAFGQDPDRSLIRFANEDQLKGTLESLSPENVVWNSSIQVKPTAFLTKEVVDLSLPGEMPLLSSPYEATLSLARGDTIKGGISSVTDQEIELDTWFAGRMKFPRAMVREIKISDRPKLLFRGPSSQDEWVQSSESRPWKYQTGSFRASAAGSIAKDMKLPDGFSLSFDAVWRNQLHLSVFVYSADLSSDQPDQGYEFSFQRSTMRLQRCGETPNFIQPQAFIQELVQDEKARIEIRASSRTKNLCLYVNGRIVETWSDQGMNADVLGKAIHFVSHDNGQIKISGIEVAEWNGEIDETPPVGAGFGNRFRNIDMFDGEKVIPRQTKDPSLEGRMMLKNGDSVAGEVVSISDGVIKLKASYGEIKLPVSRFRNIALKPASLEEPKRMNGDVRAWLVDGGSLVFRIDSFGDGKIRGYSQNFGTVDFDLKAFNRLEFNIYSSKLDQLRQREDW